MFTTKIGPILASFIVAGRQSRNESLYDASLVIGRVLMEYAAPQNKDDAKTQMFLEYLISRKSGTSGSIATIPRYSVPMYDEAPACVYHCTMYIQTRKWDNTLVYD